MCSYLIVQFECIDSTIKTVKLKVYYKKIRYKNCASRACVLVRARSFYRIDVVLQQQQQQESKYKRVYTHSA